MLVVVLGGSQEVEGGVALGVVPEGMVLLVLPWVWSREMTARSGEWPDNEG